MWGFIPSSFSIKNEWSSDVWKILAGYLAGKLIDRFLIPRIIQYGPKKLAIYAGVYSAALYSILLSFSGTLYLWRQIMLETGHVVFLSPPVTEAGFRVLIKPLPYEIITPFGLCLISGIFLMVAVCLYVKRHKNSEMPFTPLFGV